MAAAEKVERIIREVDSSMAMEGMPLSSEDRQRIRRCLDTPQALEKTLRELIQKHTVPEGAVDTSRGPHWERKYCYPGSPVLINKLNIREPASLAAAEREITSLKLAGAKARPIQGRLGFAHLRSIHRYLFEDIYSWAGELREVNIAKGNQFCLCQHLQAYGAQVFDSLKEEKFLKGAQDVPQRLAYYLSEINVLHPFREGNGRSQRLFLEYLAHAAGYSVDFSQISPQEMLIASVDSFACRYETIHAMFAHITAPRTTAE